MAEAAHRLRVLIVDDDPVSRLVAGHIAEGAGHRITNAEDAPSARRAIAEAQSRFDVIVCDYSMPAETGLDLLCSLEGPPPFILLTGVGDAAALGDVRTDRAAAFLTKPVQSSALIDAIAQATAEIGSSTTDPGT